MASAWPQRSLSALAPMIATPIFFWSILTMNEQAGKTDRRAQKPLQRNWQSDVQRIINTFDTKFQALTQYVVNAGNAHIHAAKFELTALQWSGKKITGNLEI